jgi:hypothetical protein
VVRNLERIVTFVKVTKDLTLGEDGSTVISRTRPSAKDGPAPIDLVGIGAGLFLLGR